MTDTAAYSDSIFGLFGLLGYQFCPRLADTGGARLWRVEKAADYGPFNGITEGTINTKLIIENWEDLIRLADSLKLEFRLHAGSADTPQRAGVPLQTPLT
ncbi:Tn3 family transposase [Pseudovibrio sp. Tun.PSC04-5.I4]|uniref:Tn3 family transposase n=1 Tax=Pseudovibrio sp. Tun.PSC04-5.I4 TaxID=1798213 RepID=UPI000B896C10|nr:Tn3 family transposase [Pseudovibrio sp. Tun.PSC04-5.I4]